MGVSCRCGDEDGIHHRTVFSQQCRLDDLVDKDGGLKIDPGDEIIKATLLTENGAVVNPVLLPAAAADAQASAA